MNRHHSSPSISLLPPLPPHTHNLVGPKKNTPENERKKDGNRKQRRNAGGVSERIRGGWFVANLPLRERRQRPSGRTPATVHHRCRPSFLSLFFLFFSFSSPYRRRRRWDADFGLNVSMELPFENRIEHRTPTHSDRRSQIKLRLLHLGSNGARSSPVPRAQNSPNASEKEQEDLTPAIRSIFATHVEVRTALNCISKEPGRSQRKSAMYHTVSHRETTLSPFIEGNLAKDVVYIGILLNQSLLTQLSTFNWFISYLLRSYKKAHCSKVIRYSFNDSLIKFLELMKAKYNFTSNPKWLNFELRSHSVIRSLSLYCLLRRWPTFSAVSSLH